MGMKTVMQNPSSQAMNMVVELQRIKTGFDLLRNSTYIKLSVMNSDGVTVFQDEQNLFHESSILTHFTPAIDSASNSVSDVLKVGLQVDFIKHAIMPLDMTHSARIEI